MKNAKKKILIVEDERILGEMYKERFIQGGFDVILAETAEQGIEIARKEKPDLILLDILLPRVNGIEFMEWLKKEENFSSIPVIAFSNYDDPKTRKEAAELGIKEYLIKTSFTPQQIVDRVKSYLK